MANQDLHTLVCASCGVVNPSSNSVCSGCGSILEREQPVTQIPFTETKRSKTKISQTPVWLRSVLGMFGVYVLVVCAYHIQQLPSGSVQQNQQPAAHDHTDPTVIDRISQLEKDISVDPKNAELTLQLANALHDAKFYPRAVETYKKYLTSNPKDLDARVDLGICYFETGNSEQAIREIESVIVSQPKHQMAMFNLGIIQLSSKNLTAAKKWLKKCVELDPQSTTGLRAQEILQQH